MAWRGGAKNKPKPLIFDHRFHGFDLDKPKTKDDQWFGFRICVICAICG
jgi:hypothetical protein